MCWGFKDVYLEEPPKKKEAVENNNEYIMVSSEMQTPAAPVSHVLHASLMFKFPSLHFVRLPTSFIMRTCMNFHRSST